MYSISLIFVALALAGAIAATSFLIATIINILKYINISKKRAGKLDTAAKIILAHYLGYVIIGVISFFSQDFVSSLIALCIIYTVLMYISVTYIILFKNAQYTKKHKHDEHVAVYRDGDNVTVYCNEAVFNGDKIDFVNQYANSETKVDKKQIKFVLNGDTIVFEKDTETQDSMLVDTDPEQDLDTDTKVKPESKVKHELKVSKKQEVQVETKVNTKVDKKVDTEVDTKASLKQKPDATKELDGDKLNTDDFNINSLKDSDTVLVEETDLDGDKLNTDDFNINSLKDSDTVLVEETDLDGDKLNTDDFDINSLKDSDTVLVEDSKQTKQTK